MKIRWTKEATATKERATAGAVRDEPTFLGVLAPLVNGGQTVPRCQLDDPLPVGVEDGAAHDDEGICAIRHHVANARLYSALPNLDDD